MIFLASFQKMPDSETKVLEDVPECIKGESNEKAKCSSKVRDQRDKCVAIHLMWDRFVASFGQTPQSNYSHLFFDGDSN